MSDFERNRLLTLARKDFALAASRFLLVTAISLPDTNKFKEVLRCFVRDVLLIHPSFAAEELQAFVKNLPGSIDHSRAVELVLSANYALEEPAEGNKSLNISAKHKMQSRIVSCFAVWLVLAKKVDPEIVLRLLYPTIWKHASAKVKGYGCRASQMLDLADPARVALVCTAYEGFLKEEKVRADTAVGIAEEEAQKVHQLSIMLDEANEQIKNQESCIKEKDKLIEKERESARIEKVHHLDNFEKLRGRLLRCLKSETTLLDDGLQALRRDPPKVHVMLDHADRAISNLKSEIRNLESEGRR
jgi:hypothetical protein